MATCECQCGCTNQCSVMSANEVLSLMLVNPRGDFPNICSACLNGNHTEDDFASSDESPLTLLKKRLANGEITMEEFEEIKRAIE